MKKAAFIRKARLVGACLALFGIFFTFTCDNSPFISGLGPKVDILAPVIHEVLPVSGDYLRTSPFFFRARVTDDIAVKKVELYYRQDKGSDWKKRIMTQTPGTKDWWEYEVPFEDKEFWPDPEKPSDNGPLYIYVKAYDGEKARAPTESDPNSYKIKMGPPDISLNSPDLK